MLHTPNILIHKYNPNLTMTDKGRDYPSDLPLYCTLSFLNILQPHWPFQLLLDKPRSFLPWDLCSYGFLFLKCFSDFFSQLVPSLCSDLSLNISSLERPLPSTLPKYSLPTPSFSKIWLYFCFISYHLKLFCFLVTMCLSLQECLQFILST